MARGKTYSIERIQHYDPDTGVSYLQLTSFPTPSMHLSYIYMCAHNGFTADSKTLVFTSVRSNHRDSPADLFRVDVDGTNLSQLTERNDVRGVTVAATTRAAYFLDGNTLFKVDLDTLEEQDIAHTEFTLQGWSCLTPDDRWYFVKGTDQDGNMAILRFPTDGSAAERTETDGRWNLYSVDPRGNALFMQSEMEGRRIILLVDFEGRLISRYGYGDRFAHCCPLGKSGLFQACAHLPQHALLLLGPDQGEPSVLVEGPYFWHSCGSEDGEWIIADTNWPNVGLQLACVRTRRFRRLLHPRNSAGHPQCTHGHPLFSPDGRMVAFNSDQTGVGQVCVAEIPDQFREELQRP